MSFFATAKFQAKDENQMRAFMEKIGGNARLVSIIDYIVAVGLTSRDYEEYVLRIANEFGLTTVR